MATQVQAGLINAAFYVANPRLVRKFRKNQRHLPNIASPRTLSEKYLWRKIVDRNPRFVTYSDKIAAKAFIQSRFPHVPTARMLWSGTDIADAPQELLASPCFLKANNASSTNLRLPDAALGREELLARTREWLQLQYWRAHGEWGYSAVRPALLIEEDVSDGGRRAITDFTVYVYSGRVTHIAVMTDHKTDDTRFTRFHPDGRRMVIGKTFNPDAKQLPPEYELPLPASRLVETAREIAGDEDHLRVDFMWNGDDLYFSEITLYSYAGFIEYADRDLMGRMADSWDLRDSWLFSAPQTGWRARYASWLATRL